MAEANTAGEVHEGESREELADAGLEAGVDPGADTGVDTGADVLRVEYRGSQLQGHARRWYAQALGEAIRRGRWHAVSIGEDYDPSSDYWLKGQRPPVPMILQASCKGLRASGVLPATVWLGRSDYERVLANLRADSHEAWWDWCRPRRDKAGRPVDAPALYRSAGARVVAGEYSGRHEQRAVLRFLDAAMVVVRVKVTSHGDG